MVRLLAKRLASCFVLTILLQTPGMFAAESKSLPASAETAAIEELYRLELLPRLRVGETCRMFSSYDRTGGNDDGFHGTYSKLRVENGTSILAEMIGPGCIQRMFFTHSEIRKPGLLQSKKEHIRVFVDGEKTPALDVPLEDIFSGILESFPQPLVGESQGGFYCYVPMPYRKGCKVEVDGTGVRFYHIGYRTFPSDEGIVTFRNQPSPQQRETLDAAVKAWKACGELAPLGLERAGRIEKPFVLEAGGALDWELPKGIQMVRAVFLSIKPDHIPDTGEARLQIHWDGASKPAVDLPLDFFFCQAKQPSAFRSLLAGAGKEGWYNFMPMPYRKSGKITLRAAKPLEGTLTLVTTAIGGQNGDLGYFHAVYNESLPTQTGKFHPYLIRQGSGRFVGAYLVITDSQANKKLPFWLEGDEQFTCDGELRIHGTGTEDGFNCGWYAVAGRLNGPGAAPLSGFPVYRRDGERNVAVAFRWYLADPVAYEKSISAELEHGGKNNVNANYRTAAFFYDREP